MNIPLIDGYQHIGLPRFRSAEDGIAINQASGIERAVICPFETCPDLVEIHRAFCMAPEHFRAFGLALGLDWSEIAAGLHAQFDAGFEGIRLSTMRIGEFPDVLNLVGERSGVPLVVGENALSDVASRLLNFLDRYPSSIVISPHCAGPTDPGIFQSHAAVRALFGHPRFYVVLSRHVMYPAGIIEAWAEALIGQIGWDHIMWGSEMPVSHWRDETIADATHWINRFEPSLQQRDGYLRDNARRAIFSRPARVPTPLSLPFDPFAFEAKAGAPFFPFGFAADTRLPARLVAAWQQHGGDEVEPFSAFTNRVLLRALDRIETEPL